MDARDRLVVFLAFQFVAVATLAVLVAAMLGRFPFGDAFTTAVPTGPVSRVAMVALDAAIVLLLAAPVCAVFAVLAYGRTAPDGARVWVGAAVAGLSVPTLAGIGVAGFLFGSRVGQFLAAVLLVAGVPVLASVVARALGLFERNAGDRRCGTGDTARFAVAAVVVVGVLVGVAGVAGGADALVERELFTSPQTAFEFTYSPVTDTRGVLTVRHDGGDAVRADRLYVTGEGVAPVAGTDQGTGVWAGEAAPRPDERYVLPGNETTVGVTPGCDVRLVYRRTDATGDATTLAAYECGDD